MAQQKKTSPFEDLIELIASVPWWAGLSLAVVSYFVLHALAAPDQAARATMADAVQCPVCASEMVRRVAKRGQRG